MENKKNNYSKGCERAIPVFMPYLIMKASAFFNKAYIKVRANDFVIY